MKSLDENKAIVVNAATDAITDRMTIGAEKYDPNDWRAESVARHVRRAVKHSLTALEIADGDRDDDGENHLAAACCRLSMAVAVDRESMTDATCRGCRFCKPFESQDEDETPAGICRRHPPNIDGDGSPCFPMVFLNSDWCGQYGPAEV